MNEAAWQIYRKETLRSLRFVLGSISIIPIFFLFLNHEFEDPQYFANVLYSMRIGSEVAFFSWFAHAGIWAAILKWFPEFAPSVSRSVRTRALINIALMLIGLALVGLTEPYISGRTWQLNSYTIGLLIGGGTILVISLISGYTRLKELNLQLRAQSAEASFNILKLQMQPHFLFNSLNSLAALAEQDPARAGEVTQKLADLYRKILELSKTPISSLEDETDVARLYLEIEKIRFGERLQFQIDFEESSEKFAIPSLTVQTLVENAVKHGVAKAISGGKIQVRVVMSESGEPRLEVRNTGAKLAVSDFLREGTGLRNTRERLASLGLGGVFLGEEDGWTVARIPLKGAVNFSKYEASRNEAGVSSGEANV